MKILMVDESADMRRALKSFLAEGGMEHVECEDGTDLPAAHSAHQPD